ncbi:MAG: aconitate hydratase [Candidatus Lokiarchaeota archaeon]|nr:aconitate hydratase [Candidatus Lokiarchaeota archaeon]
MQLSMSIARKILKEHLVEGQFELGEEVGIKIDHTLTQDATGTMAYLQFEAMKLSKVKTELSVSFVDHNTLQADFKNADDHAYLASVAAKYGIKFSRPGNGICHQVFLERFARPGKTLIGSDSHTPTAGGMGAIAIGAGGLDVAVAMGGGPFFMKVPKIMGIKLNGTLGDFVSAKDVILEILRRIDVKGGLGYILEYFGDGVKSLSVPERATIANMGAETGATTSIFPSDDVTREFLKLEGREDQWIELKMGPEPDFNKVIEIELSEVVPLVARPHSPGNVSPVSEVENVVVNQVAIGSCTNSSLKDMLLVAELLKGRKVHDNTTLGISPGSRQVLLELIKHGALTSIISAGARILECACGPCLGMGFAPKTNGTSVRTFNRNFFGRSGTKSANIYLSSPETAVAAAIFGKLTDPRKLGNYPSVKLPDIINIDDSLIVDPPSDGSAIEIVRGPNIALLPDVASLPSDLAKIKVLIKVEDNITTDHIIPAGAKILPFRSNLPKISEFAFEQVDPTFSSRALEVKNSGATGTIVGGENYGQGSSREHAALAPMYLGVKVILAKSFARIHRDNLINFGILPLIFVNPSDFDKLEQDDKLEILNVKNSLEDKKKSIVVSNKTRSLEIEMVHDLSEREKEIIIAGGKLNYTRNLST